MQITWWRNVVFLWCLCLCFSQPQCLCLSLCERHKLACWSSQVCLSSVSLPDSFPYLCFSSFLYVWISIFFAVQLQHHAQHRLPTFQLIFVHVIESLVFVPVCILFFLIPTFQRIVSWVVTDNIIIWKLQIMIGILFFLFEFYDDQLLAFMVLVLVWLCELFTLIRLLLLLLPQLPVYVPIELACNQLKVYPLADN